MQHENIFSTSVSNWELYWMAFFEFCTVHLKSKTTAIANITLKNTFPYCSSLVDSHSFRNASKIPCE